MPRDSNGNTVPLPGTIVSTGDTVLPSQHNPMVNDVYAMMTQSLSRDGQGGMRSPLDMSNYRVINVGPATQPTDAVSLGQFQSGTPVGAVIGFAGANAPATWMFCFGQAISRTAYPLLFAAIGTAWGAGDGTTTFNLPDHRGRVEVGKDDMGGAAANRVTTAGSGINGVALGATGGLQNHTLTVAQLAKHKHPLLDPGHVHSGAASVTPPGVNYPSIGVNPFFAGLSTTGSSGTGITMQDTGGDTPHNNMQPSSVTNKIIKVSY